MMEPAFGFEAISSAMMEMASTTKRPAQSISFSAGLVLAQDRLVDVAGEGGGAARSWLSAVDMDAASTAESRMPEITPGKILRTIVMNTREFALMDSS